MEVHIYSVKAKSQAGNIWVKCIMTTQKPIENHLGNLGILLEIQQRASAQGKSTAGAMYLSVRIHPKSFFPLKVAATSLSGSGKGTVGA